MRHLALAVALAFVLSGVARAGDMHSTGAVAPPPPPPTTTTTGNMQSTGAGQESDTVLTIILTILGIVS